MLEIARRSLPCTTLLLCVALLLAFVDHLPDPPAHTPPHHRGATIHAALHVPDSTGPGNRSIFDDTIEPSVVLQGDVEALSLQPAQWWRVRLNLTTLNLPPPQLL